jgi:hypothetical protein
VIGDVRLVVVWNERGEGAGRSVVVRETHTKKKSWLVVKVEMLLEELNCFICLFVCSRCEFPVRIRPNTFF